MVLTELPYNLPGRIYRSPMPFSAFDVTGKLWDAFKHNRVGGVVLLAGDDECLRKSGRDLRAFYLSEGLVVVYLPIPDFGVPSKPELERAVESALQHARAGVNLAIHCLAGVGRTGLFAASLAKRVLGLSGPEAVEWVRRYIPGAVEVREQYQMVMDF